MGSGTGSGASRQLPSVHSAGRLKPALSARMLGSWMLASSVSIDGLVARLRRPPDQGQGLVTAGLEIELEPAQRVVPPLPAMASSGQLDKVLAIMHTSAAAAPMAVARSPSAWAQPMVGHRRQRERTGPFAAAQADPRVSQADVGQQTGADMPGIPARTVGSGHGQVAAAAAVHVGQHRAGQHLRRQPLVTLGRVQVGGNRDMGRSVSCWDGDTARHLWHHAVWSLRKS